MKRDTLLEPWPELLATLRGDTSRGVWRVAAHRLRQEPEVRRAHARRRIRLALLATHTTDFLAELLPVAALSCGIDLTLHQTPYGQLETELLDPASALHAARPNYVLLSGSNEDLRLGAAAPGVIVAEAADRWSKLWDRARDSLGARVVQCLFTSPADDVYGNAASSNTASDTFTVAEVNAELVRRGVEQVLFVDCDRLAGEIGRSNWNDLRYWHALRQPVAPEALPLLARTVAGVLAADLGLSRRCLVVDLDNTLWRGVLGEDGPAGIAVGRGPAGESFSWFQRYLLGLRRRGMVLAVASKNDESLVEKAWDEIPGLVLRRNDFQAIVADWRPKSEQILDIARRVKLGLESLAFVDDNPAECAEVAQRLPEVDVVLLPEQPHRYVRTLACRPTLEVGRTTAEDGIRAASYDALHEADKMRAASDSLEDFLDGLQMRARTEPLTMGRLDRAAQLLQKTNQFNLTGRRYSRERLAELAARTDWRCLTLSLADRFADHGMIGLLLLRLAGDTAQIDTLLLSCRVIGRTAERRLIAAAAAAARVVGCTRLFGVHIPTRRNGLVASLYPNLGFRPIGYSVSSLGEAVLYVYPLRDHDGPADTPHLIEECS